MEIAISDFGSVSKQVPLGDKDFALPTYCNKNEASTTKKVKDIDQQVMSILRTVLERCKKEKSSNCLQVPLEDYYERVSFYTAFPKMFIYHIIDDNYNFDEDGFDNNDHIALMICINTFLAENKLSRIKDLYEKFLKCRKENPSDSKYIPDFKNFEKKIHSFRYVYKRNMKSLSLVLVEDPKLKFERFNYLYKIKNFRAKNRPIYYIDEKHIFKFPFNSLSKNIEDGHPKLFDGLVYFHVISEKSYENGIFVTRQADKSLHEIFKKWMNDIVLYSIKPNSIIVMANNFIHGTMPTKPITRYHSKKQMLQWLRKNNIPCDPHMNKPRLYELVEKCTVNNEDYDIDRIFKLHGHDVLRLPTTFPSLTPTYYLWNFINRNLKLAEAANLGILKENLLTCITGLEEQIWVKFTNIINTMENQIFDIDLLTETLLESNYEFDEKCFYEYSTNFNIEDILE